MMLCILDLRSAAVDATAWLFHSGPFHHKLSMPLHTLIAIEQAHSSALSNYLALLLMAKCHPPVTVNKC